MNRKNWFEVAKLFVMWFALVCLFGLIFATMWIYAGPALTIFVGVAIVLFLLFHTPMFRKWWQKSEEEWKEELFKKR